MTYFLQAEAPKIKFWPQFLMDLADFFFCLLCFTRTIHIFGLCGVLIRSRRRHPQFSRCGGPNGPQRPKIGIVLVKTKPTEKNQPNPSKTNNIM